ncbi:hypothetical protein FSS13T_23940 [Flavobacterium saliperosum S13]|uniref:Por secretion system C-terminal sorting domain-containing protein n=1 Tax=Flavobacterium saliperosum S13 TaxID=1341155 RepID=A0ABN0QED8_9FLAO|nr:hypothetical protein FSS13T_23940 [Flavobacterium saliperosum S13]
MAICGTIVETLPGGGIVNHNLSMCFGPLLKNSDQIGGGQDLAPVDFTFTCGSTLVITDILLVWTAANGECPVTLANNPNGKYCWDNPDVNIPTTINATETHVDAECFGSATGSINLSVTGGVPPYTYAWTASNGGVIPSGQADDQDLSGLVAGSYSVIVTDSKGCTDTVSGIAIGQDPLTVPEITKAPGGATTLCGVSDPQTAINTAFSTWLNATPVPTGGTAPYGTVTIIDPANPEAPSFTGGFTTVTWSVTDACGQTDTVAATFTVLNPCAPVCEIIDSANPACYGDLTGSITVRASAGFPAYIFYLYDTSDLTQSIATSPAVDNDLNQSYATYTFTGLSGDKTYLVVVTDTVDQTPIPDIASSCQVLIDQPDAALSSQISDVDVLCYGGATGSIDLSPSGGTPPYTYAWSATNGGVIPAGQEDDQDLSGLIAGTYSVVITDANGTTGGCRAENSAVISQPAAALSSQISDVDVLCNGAATGSIDLTPSGGTPPYAYAWTASNGGVVPAGQEDDQDLSGLVAGTYSVVITDANGNTGGCRAENSAVISQPTEGLSSLISDVDVLCYGGATGSINLSPSGGTPPYAFAWTASNGGVIPAGQEDDEDLSGLIAGTYSVIITDASGTTGGCLAQNSAVISQPDAALSSQISDVDVLCHGAATGTIDLTPSGGTPPYAYAWTASNGGVIPAGQEDDQDLSGLIAGTYSVVITDANGNTGGCRAENSAIISQPDAALSSQISDVDVLCYGAATGSIDLTPSGGTPPYAYAWTASNGGVVPAGQEDDQDLSGLVAGTYSVVITDANGNTGGCRAENSTVISQPEAGLGLILSSDPENCVGTETGSITAEFSGGTPPYTVYLNDVSVGEVASPYNFTNLGTGSYTIRVVDANDCEISDSETVDLIPCEGPNCTYTQGYYGAYNGSACTPDGLPTYDHQIIVNAVTQAGGFFRFGSVANNKYFTLYLSDVNGNPVIADNNIFKMLPGGGTPRALTGIATYGNTATWGYVPISSGRGKYGAIGNVLLSQTMTLFFNKSLDPGLGAVELETTFATADVDCGSDIPDMSSIQVFTIPQSVITYLTNNGGATVNNLFILANNVLGGVAGLPSPSDVNAAVDAINRGFDECRVSVSVPVDAVAAQSSESSTEAMFSAYPIPFKEYINVRYEFDYQSKARIEVYDAKGLFVMAYNDADAYFNKEVRLDFTFNHGEGQMFFVKVITDKGVSTKKVVSKN